MRWGMEAGNYQSKKNSGPRNCCKKITSEPVLQHGDVMESGKWTVYKSRSLSFFLLIWKSWFSCAQTLYVPRVRTEKLRRHITMPNSTQKKIEHLRIYETAIFKDRRTIFSADEGDGRLELKSEFGRFCVIYEWGTFDEWETVRYSISLLSNEN